MTSASVQPTRSETALLLELSRPLPGEDEQFDKWYKEELLPARLADGVLSARRYVDVAGVNDWMAKYDLEKADDRYLMVPSAMRESAQGVPAKLPRFEQRIYEPVSVPDAAHARQGDAHPILMAVWWTPATGTEDDFNAWYTEEHIPLLMGVPGWSAIERYRLTSGTGPTFLALHHLESIDALAHPAHRRAVDTPWRAAVAGRREQHERRIFRRHDTEQMTAAAAAVP